MIDLVHDFQKFVGIETMLLHQAAQAGAVTQVIILLQPERFVVGDLKKTGDEVADAHIDLLPEIEVMRIERVVEVEDPSLDLVEAADGALIHVAATRCCHTSWRRGFGARRIDIRNPRAGVVDAAGFTQIDSIRAGGTHRQPSRRGAGRRRHSGLSYLTANRGLPTRLAAVLSSPPAT